MGREQMVMARRAVGEAFVKDGGLDMLIQPFSWLIRGNASSLVFRNFYTEQWGLHAYGNKPGGRAGLYLVQEGIGRGGQRGKSGR